MSSSRYSTVVLVALLVIQIAVADKKHKGKCEMCQSFVDSFKAGLKDTENSNFAGGDTSWEERNQPIYADSEVRLIEILESVCSGNDYQCTRFLDDNEEDIEKWWLKLRKNGQDDLEKWLCFENLKVCCPKGTYGSECKDCPGGSESPCSGHGKCQGSGEVDGKGVCKCDKGYTGRVCDGCKDGYFSEETECKACDKSCKSTCVGGGPEKCDECAVGYSREEGEEEEKGECEDIDECDDETGQCKEGTFCSNTLGSYECLACDIACKEGCTGRGPNKCTGCTEGFVDEAGFCKDVDECSEETADCKDCTYCHNTRGTFECKDCDDSCMLTCTKAGPGGCDVCKEGFVMKEDKCTDLDECDSYPPPCNEDSELCSNTRGSYACKCQSGYTRVEGKCVSWKEADELRAKNAEKKNKKKKKKTGKKQPVVEDQDQNLPPIDIPISASQADNDIHDPPLPRQPIPVAESSVNPQDDKTEHEEL